MTIAKSLLYKFGQRVTYRQTTKGGYDPTTLTFASTATATITINVVVFPYTEGEIDGTVILSHDRRVYIAPDAMPTISPSPGDVIELQDGSVVRVESVDRIYRGTKQELYDIHARGIK